MDYISYAYAMVVFGGGFIGYLKVGKYQKTKYTLVKLCYTDHR